MLPRKLPRKPRRETVVRSAAHRAFVRSHYCSVPDCERTPIECAHVRLGSHAGTSQKPGDDRCISLCGTPAGHHAESHRIGEASFAAKYKIDLHTIADVFWARSPARQRAPRRQRCDACGENWADLPSRLCPGCQAYQDHTGHYA